MSFEHRVHLRCGCAGARAALAPRPFSFPGTTRKYERDRPFSIQHIALDLALDVPARTVRGTATLSIARVDRAATTLSLDAVGFTLGRVELDAEGGSGPKAAAFVYDGDTLTVTIPEGFEKGDVVVAYAATPRAGLYFLAPDEHVRDRPNQVWSQCQDEDARHWFPCHDKPHVKQTTEMRVRVPATWQALSNGKLVEQRVENGSAVFHWKMARPHPSYLVTLVAGEFAVIEDGTVGDVPVSYLVPKGREADGRRSFGRTREMIAHFQDVTGVTFPWEKYAQVVVSDFVFGGMENTSATTMYEHVLLDERASLDLTSDDLVAHELAHQWFGDYVTCRDWSHGWLNEGFATYFEHVDREKRLGRDEYDYGIKQDQDAYLSEASGRYARPIVSQDYEAPIDLFDRHLYEKGGLVLHMIRRELGDGPFWAGVREYLRRHAFGVVETRDLARALEDTSGKSLDRLFDQWVYRAGHPALEVTVGWESGLVTIDVKQTQKLPEGTAPFALSLEIEIHEAGGASRRELLSVTRAVETHAFPAAVRPRFVIVDPDHRVVGDHTLTAPADMLRAQLASAPTARGRWLAAQSLGKRDEPETIAALRDVLLDESVFWGARAECAYALAAIRGTEALAALRGSTGVKHPKARRAVVWALGRFAKAEAAEALIPIALSDESYAVEAEAARSLGATRQPSALDTLVDLLERPSWGDLVRGGAIDGLAALRDDRATPHLAARTRYGWSSRTRRAAVRALLRVSADRKSRELVEDLLDDADPHLRIDVAAALGDLGEGKSRSALSRALDREKDARTRRRLREVMRDLGGAARSEHQRLTEELDKLRAEQQELRARLAKLEGRDKPISARSHAAKATGPARKVAGAAAKAKPARAKRKR